ncbi:PREDICTED: uncharacterized protein LOC109584273 [Amphimedon queenslandica]|uniref:Uncharacterized protein n=1 Tax=Amphimedon queenslandica TaxID=400682 RepID=A0A1X7U919_AMPQE|nr:PREDICTED: uncharacterized protein LOC109584273 [Amphimedon queenslandica]|eukprot:XP_019855512.1 PREDICTED: uncharacterized protein LOC109584273 [Amphimedon queenslandica]
MYLSVAIASEVALLVPWNIIKQDDEELSFQSLFAKIQSGLVSTISSKDLENSVLQRVYVGTSKESFSVVDASHNVNSVCGIFGSFVKFVVAVSQQSLDLEVLSKRPRLVCDDIPLPTSLPSLLRETSRKNRLFNKLVEFCESKAIGWADPDVYGKPFLLDLSNVLWYLDGHHDVLASRSCPIPILFKPFVGFNRPELSKHRKRSISNMSRDKLLEYSSLLQEHVMSSWMQQTEWTFFRNELIALVESLASYASYLSIRNKAMKEHHSSPEPSVSFSDSSTVRHIKSSSSVSPLLSELDDAIASKPEYCKLCVHDFSPQDNRRRYLYIRELEKGLSHPIFYFTYTHNSNVGNYHFIWKAPLSASESSTENMRVIEEIKKEIPVYHTRAMRREFYNIYGRISPESKPYLLRSIYHALTNDLSTARTTHEKEIDTRVQEALLAEDPDIVIDLRHFNSNGEDNFRIFWLKCNEFLTSCTTIHERRHDTALC